MTGRSNPDAAQDRPPADLPVEVLVSVLDRLPVAICVLAADGTPLYANAAADALLGGAAEPSVPLDNLASAHRAIEAETGRPYPVERMPIVRALAGETTTVDDMELDRPAGTVSVEVWAAPILASDSSVAYAVAAFHDITERRRAQERAARLHHETVRQSRWLTAVREIQGTVLSGAGRDDALDLVVRRARELIDGDCTSIGVPDGDGFLAIRAADGHGAASLSGTRFPEADSIMGEVVGMGAAAVLDDIGCHGSLADPVVRLELGPAVFVPLGAEGRVFGSLCVARHRGGALFTEEEVAAAEAFANQAAMAIRTRDAHRESVHFVLDRDRERTAGDLRAILQSLLSAHGRLVELEAATPAADLGRGAFHEVLGDLDHALIQVRSRIEALRPPTSAATGVEKDLLDLVGQFEATTGIVTGLHVDGQAVGALAARGRAVVHIVREALSDIGSHAGARTCRVGLGRAPDGLVVHIEDDGRGVHAAQSGGRGGQPAAVADLVERLGGRLDVRSAPGRGNSVTVTLPTGSAREREGGGL